MISARVAAVACPVAASAASGTGPNVPSSSSMAWPCAVATMAELSRVAAVSSWPASAIAGARNASASGAAPA